MEPCKNDGMPPRPKLPYCRSAPWPTTSMGKWAKEGGAATDGGKITLLPTHLHPQYLTRGTSSVAGWGWLAGYSTYELRYLHALVPDDQGGLSIPSWFCSVQPNPTIQPYCVNHSLLLPPLLFFLSSEHPSSHLCLLLSLIIFKLAFALAFPPAGRPHQPVTDRPVFVAASCSADATPG